MVINVVCLNMDDSRNQNRTPHNLSIVEIMQGLIGCLMGAIHHKKFNFVSGPLLGHMGVPIFIMSFIGGYLSHFVSNTLLLILFATLALAASMLIFIPVKGDSENPDVNQLDFKKYRAVMASAGVGLLGTHSEGEDFPGQVGANVDQGHTKKGEIPMSSV